MENLESRIRRIEAQQDLILSRHQIENTLGRYARGIDRLDLDVLKSAFHPDGTNHAYDGDANLHAWCDEIIPALRSLFSATMHHITHKSIEIRGDRAASESYFISWHLVEGDRAAVARFFGETYANEVEVAGHLQAGHEYMGCGRYLHEWERRDGVWRILQRTATLEWNHFSYRTVCGPGSLLATIQPLEQRDRSDPVYALFERIGASAS
jgi:hypothetical protein